MSDRNNDPDGPPADCSPYLVDPHERRQQKDDIDENHEPKPAQWDIINSDAYPIRVLAGAGTGKTFTMVRKIEQILEDTPPNEILALTFTNKAADSMREKLAERLDSRAYDIDAYTYHSIAHEILSEHAYEAEIDPDFDIASEPEQYAIIFEILDEIEYRFIAPKAYSVDYVGDGAEAKLHTFITECKQKGITPESLVGSDGYLPPANELFDLIDKVERIEEAADAAIGSLKRKQKVKQEHYTALYEGLQSLESEIDAINDKLTDCIDDGDGHTPACAERDFCRYLHSMRRFISGYRAMLDGNEDSLVGSEMTGVLKYPLYVFGATGSSSPFPDNLDPVCLTDDLRSFVESCMAARDLTVGYQRYEEKLDDYGFLDLQDLILEATRVVADSDIATEIDTRWEYVFCDEFQDTDPIQFELVANLVGDEKLFVVGDDDQAVYEWRGANVDNIRSDLEDKYGEAKSAPIAELRAEARQCDNEQNEIERTPQLLGEGHSGLTDLPLEQNFRSVQPILDLANAAVERIPNRGSSKQLRAVGEAADASEGVYTVQTPLDEEGKPDEEQERTQIVNTIRRLVTAETDVVSEPHSLGDIAVLVRANDEAQALATRLDNAGIPYEIAGGMASHSTGVETVIAFLKVLANPADDVSLNRVLRMRYRLHEDDLKQLNSNEPSSLRSLLQAEQEDRYRDWDAIAEAQSHFTHLLRRRESYSLSRLYTAVKQTTDIEWYLTEREREDLGYLDDVISQFGQGSIQPELDPGFIAYLQTHAATVRDSGGVNAQPDLADDAVNILTTHKSKGLEFKTVLLPHLHSWGSGNSRKSPGDYLLETIDNNDRLPTRQKRKRRERAEERRVLHVAITRAEENLILFGRADDEQNGSNGSDPQWGFFRTATPDNAPNGVNYIPERDSFHAWRTIQECSPPSARDVTDTLATDLSPEGSHNLDSILDDASESDSVDDTLPDVDLMDPEVIQENWRAPFREAANEIIQMGTRMASGELPPVDLETYGIASSVTEDREMPFRLQRHSYTSLSLYNSCPRQHYLKYIVGAPTIEADYDPLEGTNREDGSTSSASRGVSNRDVGIVFHETAEEIMNQCVDPELGGTDAEDWPLSIDDWLDVAKRRCQRQNSNPDALMSRVRQCIETLFETDVVSWTPRASEHSFEFPLHIEDRTESHKYMIVGTIDAIFEKPDGSIIVIDYKTGERKPDQDDLQLKIYALAAEKLFDDPIDSVGYVFLNNEVNQDIWTKTESNWSLDSYENLLKDRVLNASENEYIPPKPGSHCGDCSYRWLPCFDPKAD